MPEGLLTSDGKPLDVENIDQEFARAMASAPSDDIPAPPRLQPEEPKARARRTTHDKPRTTTRAPRAKADDKARPASAELNKQRAEGVKGLVQLSAGMCLVADQRVKGDSFKADALTLSSSAESLADACVQTAIANPRFGALLDRVTNVGPYAALITVSLSVGAQLARNHGVAAAEALGAVAPETLLATLDEKPAA